MYMPADIVCETMELSDLIELAESNKEAACSAFHQMYGPAKISFLERFFFKKDDTGYIIKPNNIIIERHDFLVEFLRTFGHLVKELRISGGEGSSFKWATIYNLICTNCTTIQKLYFYNDIDVDPVNLADSGTSFVTLAEKNPLRLTAACPTLEMFDVENIYIDVRLKLSAYFPNLRALNLQKIATSNPSFIEVDLPEIEHLGISLADDYYNDDFDTDHQINISNVKSLMALNPQLKSVSLNLKMDYSFVERMNAMLPNLQTLEWFLWFNGAPTGHNVGNVFFNNVTKAKLENLDRCTPPAIFPKLQELEVDTNSDWHSIKYITLHQSITHLTLDCSYHFNQAYCLIRKLQNLQNLHVTVSRNKWPAKDMHRFLHVCEQFDEMTLKVGVDENNYNYINWQLMISNIWNVQQQHHNFFIIQKMEFVS